MKAFSSIKLKDPVPQAAPALKVPKQKTAALSRGPKLKSPKATGFNPQPGKTNMFGNRAMKSPEDYETAEGVQGLGREASPYFAQQFAKKGRQLRYDTATQTYR